MIKNMLNDNDKNLINNIDNDITSEVDTTPDLDLTPIDQELELELLKKNELEEEHEFRFRPGSRRDERQLALYLLYALDRAEYSISLSEAARAFEKGFEIIIPDNSYALTLTQGVLDSGQELDASLTPFLKNWRLERLGCCTRLILHLALWELRKPDAISSIIINEAIELAKMFAEKDAYRFVNGILDEVSKQMAASQTASDETSTQEVSPSTDTDDDVKKEEEA